MKTYGIYLVYPPELDLRAEGLGRHLAQFLKEAKSYSTAKFVLACPSWTRKSLGDLLEGVGISPDAFEIIGPKDEPMFLKLYRFYQNYRRRTRRQHRIFRLFSILKRQYTRNVTRAEGLMVTTRSGLLLASLALLGLPLEGVIIRGFHIYPMVVRPPRSGVRFNGTIDDDLVANLAICSHERYLAKDSRQLFCCELSSPDYAVAPVAERGNLDAAANFYLSYAPQNAENLRQGMIITARDELGPMWAEKHKASEEFIVRLLERYAALLEQRRRQDLCIPTASGVYPALSDDQALAKADVFMAAGQPVPLGLEEQCLQIHLKAYPDRCDLLQRLCAVLTAQGKHVPLVLEARSLEALLVEHPDREDLRERLREVQVAIRRLTPT